MSSDTSITHVTIAEAAREVGVHDDTLRRIIADGIIRVVRIGRTIRVPVEEISRLGRLIEMQEDGVRQEEAARRLGVSALTISRAIRNGEIDAHKNIVGRGGYFIEREEFERICRGELASETEVETEAEAS